MPTHAGLRRNVFWAGPLRALLYDRPRLEAPARRPKWIARSHSLERTGLLRPLEVGVGVALGLLWVGVTFACPGARRMVGSTGVCRIDDNHTVAAVVIHSAHIHLGGDGRS